MPEYIEREKALSFPLANDQYDHVHADPHFIAGCETYKAWLSIIPAADVAEVVRCADCRCFQANMRQDGYLPNGVPEYECRWWCGEVDPTDYCSHAKRKDGGQDDV